MTALHIDAPRADEAAEISELALRSKAHWGYDDAFLERCRSELTYAAEDCLSGEMFVGRVGGRIVGFGRVRGEPPTGELSALFVDPPWIGEGIGARLLAHALDDARRRGMSRVWLEADPGAESFYAHFGAVRVGETPSGSIPGRLLPRMEFSLGAAETL